MLLKRCKRVPLEIQHRTRNMAAAHLHSTRLPPSCRTELQATLSRCFLAPACLRSTKHDTQLSQRHRGSVMRRVTPPRPPSTVAHSRVPAAADAAIQPNRFPSPAIHASPFPAMQPPSALPARSTATWQQQQPRRQWHTPALPLHSAPLTSSCCTMPPSCPTAAQQLAEAIPAVARFQNPRSQHTRLLADFRHTNATTSETQQCIAARHLASLRRNPTRREVSR
jgi:hypothetical protein